MKCLILLATCTMNFSSGETQETVIHSDSMEMTAQEDGNTIFQFSGNVQVTSDTFRATAHALTASLLGNPIVETVSGNRVESTPQLTQLLAKGGVQIWVHQQTEEERTGSADQIDIDPIHDLFILSGNAQIHQKGKGNISGDRIILDRRQNHLKIEGDAPENNTKNPPQRPTIKLDPSAIALMSLTEMASQAPSAEQSPETTPALSSSHSSAAESSPTLAENSLTKDSSVSSSLPMTTI